MIWVLTILIALFTIIVEIFTIVFMLTGLSHNKSKFQVISILTSTGFTTKESELVMLDPKRRRYAQILIVFGYCFSVTIVSMLVTSINGSSPWYEYVIAITLLATFIFLLNNHSIRKKIDPKIQKFGAKLMYGENENYLIIIESLNEKIVGKIKLITLPSKLKNQTLEQLDLSNEYQIQLLAIERNGETLKNINKDVCFEENDLIVVYGEKNNIIETMNIVKTDVK